MGYQVVIPAAGSGARMEAGQNKLLVNLEGKPVIAHTLQIFENDDNCEGIIIVVKGEELSQFQAIARFYDFKKIGRFVLGGNERQDSVRHGLRHISGDGVVLIHDGARPFVPRELISHLYETASRYGAAIPAVPIKDTIKKVANDWVETTLNRDQLKAAQTPQAFHAPIILKAHQFAKDFGYMATDDAALVEWMGQPVMVIKGDYRNIKITTREDFMLSRPYLTTEDDGRSSAD